MSKARLPRISTLMLVHNHERFLHEAITGVVSQRGPFELELLIGEDCSTDNSLAIAAEYASRYPGTVRILSSAHNVGGIENFRRLLDASCGDFIAICEGDDYWVDSRKLALQLEALAKAPGVDIVVHSCRQRIGEEPELRSPTCVLACRDAIIPLRDVIAGDGGFVPSASLLVRKNALLDIPSRVYDIAPVLDYFWQVYGARRGGAVYINRPMSVYRVQTAGSWNASMREPLRRLQFERAFYDSVLRCMPDFEGCTDAFAELVFRHYRGRALQAHREGDALLLALSDQILRRWWSHLSLVERIQVQLSKKRGSARLFYAAEVWRGWIRRWKERLWSGAETRPE